MPKLRLKRTPAGEEEYLRKKAKKRARRAAQERETDADRSQSRSRSPRLSTADIRNNDNDPKRYTFVFAEDADNGEEEGEYGPQPPSDPGPSTSKRKKYTVEREDSEDPEEQRFAAKMRDALADDTVYDPLQRLDSVEARMNSYTHVPRRWRGTDEGFSAALWMEDAREELGGLEPWQMNDDEYAEYMRAGMWRKKHAAEFQERLRRKEEREARRRHDRQLREETKRLEQEARAERDARRAARAKRKREAARALYEDRWTRMLERPGDEGTAAAEFSYEDIPWPVAPPTDDERLSVTMDDISPETISSFLLSSSSVDKSEGETTSVKDVLRATMLRFHPDKFEARVLARVREEDKAKVKEVADVVVRALNTLMKDIATKLL